MSGSFIKQYFRKALEQATENKLTKTYTLTYVSGSERIPIEQRGYKLKLSKQGIKLYMFGARFSWREQIKWAQMLGVSLENVTQDKMLSAGKALAGGILLGPVGAIAGGMAGGKKQRTMITIRYREGSTDRQLVLATSPLSAPKVKANIDAWINRATQP